MPESLSYTAIPATPLPGGRFAAQQIPGISGELRRISHARGGAVGMYDTFTRMDKLPTRDVLDFYGSLKALTVNGSPRTFFANEQFHTFLLASRGR